ncbi:hypothetical protein PV325_010171, partial [Microctonus aethiopoides]
MYRSDVSAVDERNEEFGGGDEAEEGKTEESGEDEAARGIESGQEGEEKEQRADKG